ncbi:MAG TPA: hypothetical protein VF941_04855 [Clostridia bacterium]
MAVGVTKRVIVLKDIPSNIIEEAILVLKGDPGSLRQQDVKHACVPKSNELILKEAQDIINDFIRKGGLKTECRRQMPGFLKNIRLSAIIINMLLIGTIVALVCFILRVV